MTTIEENLHYFFNFRYANDVRRLEEGVGFRERDFQTVVKMLQDHLVDYTSSQFWNRVARFMEFIMVAIIMIKVFTL